MSERDRIQRAAEGRTEEQLAEARQKLHAKLERLRKQHRPNDDDRRPF